MKTDRLLWLAAAVFFLAGAAEAAPVVIRDFDHLALAPGGDRIVDLEASDPGNAAQEPHHVVVVRDANGKIVAQVDPCPVCDYGDTAWSPKGGAFAFVAVDKGAGKAMLYVVSNAAPRAVATITGYANTVRWSPDGSRLAWLVTVGAHKNTGATEAGAALVGRIGESADEQRIAIVPIAGGAMKLVSPADTYVYEFDWAPDGKGFAVTAAKGNGDNNWWIATLDYLDAASGKLRVITAPNMQIELPRVSPDGKTVAFIGGLMSDWQSIGGDVYTVPLAGGAPVDQTPGYKRSFRSIDWRGGDIAASAIADGDATFETITPSAHPPGEQAYKAGTRIEGISIRPNGVSSAVSYSADGFKMAFIAEGFNQAYRIWFGHFYKIGFGVRDRVGPFVKPVTHENDLLAQNVSEQSVHWTNEGFHLQGWLIGPKHVTQGKHPMVVIVHGGPSSAYTPHYVAAGGQHGTSFDFVHELIEKGYFIFYPNDRGSYGQGEAFTRANVKDFGRGDLRDMLAGVDAAEKIAPIDDARLGLYGHSYGGWFSMWANTQTRRFKAFVAGAGIANWTSYYGQNGIDRWMIPFFGASIYDDPAVYRAASPIEFIKAAKTPTLLYVGERDIECPAPQSLEYWHALHELGTPAELYIYAGEGHHFRKASDLTDLRGRIVGWFGTYLK